LFTNKKQFFILITLQNSIKSKMTNNKELLTLEDISKKLKDRKLYVVSEATGLSFPTLKKLVNGETNKYNYSTLKSISDYFKDEKVSNLSD